MFFLPQRTDEEKATDLFTSKGLKPTMEDLDNIFDDSSDETDMPNVRTNVTYVS